MYLWEYFWKILSTFSVLPLHEGLMTSQNNILMIKFPNFYSIKVIQLAELSCLFSTKKMILCNAFTVF